MVRKMRGDGVRMVEAMTNMFPGNKACGRALADKLMSGDPPAIALNSSDITERLQFEYL